MDQTIKPGGIMPFLLEHAKAAAMAGEVPVAAAVTTSSGKVIAIAENRMIRDDNALHHAEMLAISAAIKKQKTSRLDACDLWVTLEPCTMCAGAIANARLRRLYFGAFDEKAGAVESGIRFFDQPSCHHKLEIYGGLSATASTNLLHAFFLDRR